MANYDDLKRTPSFPDEPEELGWRPRKKSSNPFGGIEDTNTTEVPGFSGVSETQPIPRTTVDTVIQKARPAQTSSNQETIKVGFNNVNSANTQTPTQRRRVAFPEEPQQVNVMPSSISTPRDTNDLGNSETLNVFGSSAVKNEPVQQAVQKPVQSLEDYWDENEDTVQTELHLEDEYQNQPQSQYQAQPQQYNNGGNNNVPPSNDNTPKRSKKNNDPKKGQFKKDPKVLNVIVTIFTIIMNVLVTFIMMNISRYASFSKNIFLAINIGVLAALLLLDLLVILMIRTKKIALFVISTLVVCLFLGAGGYGVYAVNRANTSVDNLTATVKEENVTASLVIYSGTSGDPITDISDLEGRKVGTAVETKTAEIAQTKLSNEGINVTYETYNGYTELFSALISGEVDCAVLPVTYQSQFEEDESLAAYVPDTESILDFSETITSTGEVGADKDITKEPFTVLVTGENEGLADSIILMSVNPVSMKVTMTSIARDSYVPISCYGSSDKINSAHAASESCMVQTVENMMGIDIDYTIEFNFASVIQVVDAVGGVDVDVEVAFAAQGWDIETDSLQVINLNPGYQHLDGIRTLGYVRERHAFADGDFARQRHQQEVIEQIIGKLLSSGSPQMFLDVLDAAGDNMKTNFTVDQMTSFINYALQKSKRYYNEGDIAGLFNFEQSRVYGYSANLWNSALQMDLWIYRLWNGSIEDCAAAIEENMDLEGTPDTPVSVSWSAADTYTPPAVSQETYNETMITDDGRPETTATTNPCEDGYELGADGQTCVAKPTESTDASSSPDTEETETPDPTPTPTPTPTATPCYGEDGTEIPCP